MQWILIACSTLYVPVTVLTLYLLYNGVSLVRGLCAHLDIGLCIFVLCVEGGWKKRRLRLTLDKLGTNLVSCQSLVPCMCACLTKRSYLWGNRTRKLLWYNASKYIRNSYLWANMRYTSLYCLRGPPLDIWSFCLQGHFYLFHKGDWKLSFFHLRIGWKYFISIFILPGIFISTSFVDKIFISSAHALWPFIYFTHFFTTKIFIS